MISIISMVARLIYHPIHSVLRFFTYTSLPAFVVFVFLMIAILTGVRWNLSVDSNAMLICILLRAKDAEQFFL
jgi:hypothetical protein